MREVLWNALEWLSHDDHNEVDVHNETDVSPNFITWRRHRNPRLPTNFENCTMTRLLPFGMGKRQVGRLLDGKPCRTDQEESCNQVHATCARTLKFDSKVDGLTGMFSELLDPCKPESMTNDITAGLKNNREGWWSQNEHKPTGVPPDVPDLMKTALKKLKAKSPGCNARLVDMPYGLMSPEAKKGESRSLKAIIGLKRPVRTAPSRSVWGLAVHGLSGTPFFDSGGNHISDYIYSIKQGNGLPDDYYVCDSRVHPQACALIGGNIRHACAEWYDPEQCGFCEDNGSSIQCEVRGWNNLYSEWVKVPIYPRDLLGEMYRGEFADVMSRPLWASITIPKAALKKPVKELPYYMTTNFEPHDLIKLWKDGPSETLGSAKGLITGSKAPDPTLLALRPERISERHGRRQSAPGKGLKRACLSVKDFL